MQRVYYIIIIFLLLSCSKYQRLLKSDDLNLKLEKAKEYYLEAQLIDPKLYHKELEVL